MENLDDKPVQVFLSRSMQVADLIGAVTEQIGPSDICQSSFSIAEEYIRRLHYLKEDGHILSADIILDFKATNKTISLWPFLQRVADRVFLASNHSKVILIKARESGRKVAVITSQNLTRGNRNESAVVMADEARYDQLMASLDDIMKNSSLPLGAAIENKLNDS